MRLCIVHLARLAQCRAYLFAFSINSASATDLCQLKTILVNTLQLRRLRGVTNACLGEYEAALGALGYLSYLGP
jgi:hypothetical protein